MNDYTQIDVAILAEIDGQRNATWSIVEATNHITKPYWNLCDASGMRVVDRRLQALKKAGKISYSRANGWVIAAKKVTT